MRVQLNDIHLPIGSCILKRTEAGAEIILGNGKSFSITLPESCILETLINKPNAISTKDELIVAAWGSPDIIGPNSLPVAITNLRKVLELDNIKIINVPRKGYKTHIPEFETSLDPPQPHQIGHNSFTCPLKHPLSPHRFYQWLCIALLILTLFLGIILLQYLNDYDLVNVQVDQKTNQLCLAKKDNNRLLLSESSQSHKRSPPNTNHYIVNQ